MKKIILSLLFTAAFIFTIPMLFADPGQAGTVVVHYKAWDSNYDNLHAWVWGSNEWGNNIWKPRDAQLDDFGAVFTFSNVIEVEQTDESTFGFIAALGEPEGTTIDWDYVNGNGSKKTNDVNIPKNIIKAGQTIHVYVFEGADKNNGQSAFVADPTKHNMLLTYFDPSGSYEANLGIHHWSGWDLDGAEWGTPLQVFENGGKTVTGVNVKVAMLTATPEDSDGVKDAGFLIYAGGDNNKKTGDVKLRDSFGSNTAPAGQTAFAWVYSKGDGYTTNDNVLYGDDFSIFIEEAFTFRLIPFKNDAVGPSGTYAKNPVTVFVKTSTQIENIYATALPVDKADAMETMVAYFELVEKTGENTFGEPISIMRLDFAPGNSSVSDFVINLDEEDALDNTKQYVLRFDDGTNEAEVELALDTTFPTITFMSPVGIVGKPANERIINVQWGVPYNIALFPQFVASDDRDGTLTPFVFVPEGSNSTVNTSVAGDYVITLQVSDSWGNTTTETFILRVTD